MKPLSMNIIKFKPEVPFFMYGREFVYFNACLRHYKKAKDFCNTLQSIDGVDVSDMSLTEIVVTLEMLGIEYV